MRRFLLVLLLVPLVLSQTRVSHAGSCEDECDSGYGTQQGPSCESEQQRRADQKAEQDCVAHCQK